MTTTTVSSGSTLSNTTITSGNVLLILSGGTAANDVVLSGATEIVSSGGLNSGGTISSGGRLVGSSGAVLSGTLLDQGVISGGTTTSAAGANYTPTIGITVQSGGIASGVTAATSGTIIVGSGGTASNDTISGIFAQEYVSGGTTYNETLVNQGFQTVKAGGTAIGTTLVATSGNGIGYEYVSSGGTTIGLTVNGGGVDYIYAGGVTSATTVTSGGTEFVNSGGIAHSTTISSGGSDIIYAGGTASATTVALGGLVTVSGGIISGAVISATSGTLDRTATTITVSSGGTAIGTTVTNGYLHVLSAGVASNTVVNAGSGALAVEIGGTAINISVGSGATDYIVGVASNTILSAGGFEYVYSGARVVSTTVYSGAVQTLEVASATTTGTIINSGGSQLVTSGATATSTVIGSGGAEIVSSGGITSATTISGGNLLLATGSVVSGGIAFTSGTSGTITIGQSLGSATVVSGFALGDAIVMSGVTSATSDNYAVNADVVTVTAGSSSFVETIQGATTNNVHLASNSAGTLELVSTACFLPGTLIATPRGDVAVERLVAGDVVLAVEQGVSVARQLCWTGQGVMDVELHARSRELCPVRICADAFEPGQPRRDLLVTPEHAIMTDGMLVPARMLVNGGSIRIDDAIRRYTYHHLELAQHGILLAEGLTTESYLDGGNREQFMLHDGTQAAQVVEPAVPLTVRRDVVEPIWQRLAARSITLGFPATRTDTVVTGNSGLRLLLDDGRTLDAFWLEGMRYTFHIPRGARPVQLLSHAATPAAAIGPFCDDRRRLGVAVEKLVFWRGLSDTTIGAADFNWCGWHDLEGISRWTNGSAELDLPEASEDTVLDVHVVDMMRYCAQAAA